MTIGNIFLALLLCYIADSQNPDKINSIPLLKGTLGPQYSGYIEVDATAGRKFHYWFVESAQNPATDPLVLWLNGGPGCSSLDGFFYENGPWKFNTSSPTPQLLDNPYSWHKIANVLFLESPAGVGFSFSNSPNDYLNQTDTRTAHDNYVFLQSWFKRYPQYLKNDFWITGESYGGIYVPSLAQLVLQGVLDGSFVIPFKGIMVGNGVANSAADEITVYVDFLYGHGLVNNKLYTSLIAACTANPSSQQCLDYIQTAENGINNIDIYNIYGDCYHQRPMMTNSKLFKSKNNKSPQGVPPCTDAFYATQYLSRADVKVSIHVNTGVTWSICNDAVNGYYVRTINSMIPIHQYLVKNGLRVLIYSGDVDFSVPYTDTEYWTANQMGLSVTSDWHQWFYTDGEGQQVGGFATQYGPNFSFVTVRGSGHMVPQFRPNAAYVMYSKTLKGEPL